MTNKLTAKQENFARKYVECGNASEAYRTAYDVGEDTKPETIWNDAYKQMLKPDVNARVIELQLEASERTKVTVESLTKKLDVTYDLAKKTKQPAAMTAATMGQAKLHGLDVNKTEITGKNGAPATFIFTPVGNEHE